MGAATDATLERFRLSEAYQQIKRNFHRHLIQQIEERSLDIDAWDAGKTERFVAEQMRRFVFFGRREQVNVCKHRLEARDPALESFARANLAIAFEVKQVVCLEVCRGIGPFQEALVAEAQ